FRCPLLDQALRATPRRELRPTASRIGLPDEVFIFGIAEFRPYQLVVFCCSDLVRRLRPTGARLPLYRRHDDASICNRYLDRVADPIPISVNIDFWMMTPEEL